MVLSAPTVWPFSDTLTICPARRRGVPVGYILFEGEGHGFRKSETNLASLQAELAFFSRIFGVTPPERLPPIPLLNAETIEAAAT